MGKGKGKGKKNDGGGEGGAELTPMEVAKLLQAENLALQRQLAERQEEATKAMASRREIQNRVIELKRDFEDEQKQTFQITADMTRQYKSMQEELLTRINILENTINELNDKLEQANASIDDMKKERAEVIAQKDAEINEHKQRMEDMAKEFGDMLKETLDKMGERIDVSGKGWENESAGVVQQKLAEFKV
ncbi:Coiled-coil domain-containing protein 153 [Hondaea fermentalgiana]|uniref:Dynein regulatory complex protein 12 n=1 Tax=Hondaea fermentalgiana TaxID=2315210 RepID=A0A2R5GR88_9STRA|nr:Coiled-coil domain-containing protein 153 [Hondaea fermentalgiana]|eukprot:GBG30394.1 Coiled-coil domain-containing protein 153 [Hondaea fermentalgiana]